MTGNLGKRPPLKEYMTTSDLQLMRLGLKRMAELPNREGYQFIGLKRDLTVVECKVVKSPSGFHTITGAAFCDLIGWKTA